MPGMLADAVFLEEVLSSEEMRRVIARPRKVPRSIRERIAEIVVREVMLGEDCVQKDHARTARRLGPLFYVFLAVRQTEEWAVLKQIASRCQAMAVICARNALATLFDAFEEVATREAGPNASQAQITFAWLIQDTIALWGRGLGKACAPDDRIESFESAAGGAELMSGLAQEQYVPRIREFIEEMEESADAIELLTMLYPGRMWDRGQVDLHKEDIWHIKQYADIAARSGELQQLLEMLGRSATAQASGKSTMDPAGRSELHTVANSHDLQYLLPSELVKLQDPTLKHLFMACWAEGKLLTYQLRGRTSQGTGDKRQGPIVALVDTSGSMSGSPGMMAKAVVLASAKMALSTGRGMRVVLFSSSGQSRAIDLSRERTMAAEFIEFLRQTFGGGTDFNTALGAGFAALKDSRYKGADLLFITDGLSRVTDEALLEEWQRFRTGHGARIYSVIVGNDSAGGLERISDETFIIENGKGGLSGTMKMTAI